MYDFGTYEKDWMVRNMFYTCKFMHIKISLTNKMFYFMDTSVGYQNGQNWLEIDHMVFMHTKMAYLKEKHWMVHLKWGILTWVCIYLYIRDQDWTFFSKFDRHVDRYTSTALLYILSFHKVADISWPALVHLKKYTFRQCYSHSWFYRDMNTLL